MPPSGTAPPPPATAGYSGTPLPKKLGIKPGTRVVLVKAPDGFAELLEPLPPDVTLRTTNRGARDVTLWFTRSLAGAGTRLDAAGAERWRRAALDRLAEEDLRRWPPITPGTTCGASDSRLGWSISRSAPSTMTGRDWRSCGAGAE